MRVIKGEIASAIDAFVTRRPADGGTWITTQCLYPGGDSVPVFVAGGPRTFTVSDEGAGWDALLAAGTFAALSAATADLTADVAVIGGGITGLAMTLGRTSLLGARGAEPLSAAALDLVRR